MRLPNDSNRSVIVGKTGSGKTWAGIWQLSLRDVSAMPWVIFDFKRDGLITSLPARETTLDKFPTENGLHVVHPMPGDDAAIETFLWECWKRGNVGLYIDEGYMIPSTSEAFDSILTQGRSKHIPVIMLSQRPVWLSRFVFSEADFFQLFWLNDKRDRKTVQGFLPEETEQRLPEFHSWYYDVGADELNPVGPVPGRTELIAAFPPLPEAAAPAPAARLKLVVI